MESRRSALEMTCGLSPCGAVGMAGGGSIGVVTSNAVTLGYRYDSLQIEHIAHYYQDSIASWQIRY